MNEQDLNALMDERDELRQILGDYEGPLPGVEERLEEVNKMIDRVKAELTDRPVRPGGESAVQRTLNQSGEQPWPS